MRAGRIVVIVLGCLVGVLGLGLLIVGAVATIAYGVGRDDDGFFRTDEVHLATPTAAITSDRVDLNGDPGDADWLIDRGTLGTVTLNVRPTREDQDLFAAIGPSADVATYLGSVSHDRIEDFDDGGSNITYERQEGSATPEPPGEQTFWVAQMTTSQTDALTWEVESGDWTILVMNADGSSGVDADARVGIKIDWLLPVAIGLMIVGYLLLAGGTVAAVFAARGPRQPNQPLAERAAPLPPPGAAAPASTTTTVVTHHEPGADGPGPQSPPGP